MEPFVGQIMMVGFNFAPVGWALCNGQLLSISQNAALFSLIGTYYGGNGVSTFALPNLQGRVPIHQGQSPGTSNYVIGQVGGVENTTLLVNNMPVHNHSANGNSGPGASGSPIGNVWAEVNDGGRTPVVSPAYAPASTGQMASSAIGMAGGSQPFSILQPYLCVNFIIALVGIFPSRG
jgi:microcystin-dependent protein